MVKDTSVDVLKADPVGGARVMLSDAAGEVVAQIRSEFDGYYFFSDLKLATYTVRLAAGPDG